ncbi:MAG: D-glutamate cyclase [Gaiellales bacterium]|nr:D-glutamate cyclase [Gaiellales bacterium]
MTDAPQLETFENIDRVVTIEMRPQGIPRGIIRKLYEAARSNGPLSHETSTILAGLAGKRVAVVTGIVFDKLPKGEVDGPLGSAFLAKALNEVGVEADVMVPDEMVPVVEAIRVAIGGSFAIVQQSREPGDYAAAVTVEKLGRNSKGQAHTIFGAPFDQGFDADDFIEAMNREGRPTIGIGDGGNEIGFGAMFNVAQQLVPAGRNCGCPCGGGVITTTATKVLFPAAVSNYGAYAIVGGLAVLSERPELFPEEGLVTAGLRANVDAGGLDGGSFHPNVYADDGIPVDGVEGIVTVMRTIVQQHFRTSPRKA